MYTTNCCGMIAVKREVAARPQGSAGFPWSECQEARRQAEPKNLTASHCTNICLQNAETRVLRMFWNKCGEIRSFYVREQDTHGRVYSHRLSYLINLKVRKGGDFFYGKSSNENHTQGL